MTKKEARAFLALYNLWAVNYRITAEQAAMTKGGKTSDQYAAIVALSNS